MATEPKTSHGHGDISCCREEKPRCRGRTLLNIVLMWLICLKIAALCVLFEANIPQLHALAAGGEGQAEAPTVPVILLKSKEPCPFYPRSN